jgi:S-adenosylmethionine decarboxylase
MKTGTEWLIDAAGCDPALLADLGAMRGLCDAVVADLGLCSIGEPRWHQFPFPGGVTGMYLLTESHLTCHSFPELRAATFNLYCCRPRAVWPWESRLPERLGAAHVVVHCLPRGEEPLPDAGTRGRLAATVEEGE